MIPGDLACHPFLRDLPLAYVGRLAGAAHPVEVRAGHRFFRDGDPADRFWLIETGKVALDLHLPGRGAVIVETLGPGTVLGWSWLFPPHEWRFGAVATEPVRAIEIDGERLRSRAAADPAFGHELVTRFAAVLLDRLQATRIRLLDLYAAPGGVS